MHAHTNINDRRARKKVIKNKKTKKLKLIVKLIVKIGIMRITVLTTLKLNKL